MSLLVFRSLFPQFASTPDQQVNDLLLQAQTEWAPSIDNYDVVCLYTVAHWLHLETLDLSEQVAVSRSPQRSGTGSGSGSGSRSVRQDINRSSDWSLSGYGKRVTQLTNNPAPPPLV